MVLHNEFAAAPVFPCGMAAQLLSPSTETAIGTLAIVSPDRKENAGVLPRVPSAAKPAVVRPLATQPVNPQHAGSGCDVNPGTMQRCCSLASASSTEVDEDPVADARRQPRLVLPRAALSAFSSQRVEDVGHASVAAAPVDTAAGRSPRVLVTKFPGDGEDELDPLEADDAPLHREHKVRKLFLNTPLSLEMRHMNAVDVAASASSCTIAPPSSLQFSVGLSSCVGDSRKRPLFDDDGSVPCTPISPFVNAFSSCSSPAPHDGAAAGGCSSPASSAPQSVLLPSCDGGGAFRGVSPKTVSVLCAFAGRARRLRALLWRRYAHTHRHDIAAVLQRCRRARGASSWAVCRNVVCTCVLARLFEMPASVVPSSRVVQVSDLIEGVYKETVPRFVVIDCRFPYEFRGGHIRSAVNMTQQEAEQAFLNAPLDAAAAPLVMIFHCEFSSRRAPTMYVSCRRCACVRVLPPVPGLSAAGVSVSVVLLHV